ncbi:hypothetical protein BCV70DRAFT_156608 [Testicularia cyperi]|uniref:SWIM-type domain-containing protein n=1 Tax=Testicularia cyperi TaxID=1882483 RepID=A0A317XU39_9BASI|nr:hypothetical protein BCV70DRAFT_156608 [Testicularia cyperi]
MDSTHNTCSGRTIGESVYLYTIVVRSQITGQGAPAAFLLTNTENQLPVTNFLKALQDQLNFKPQFLMIDCSETEAAAIDAAFHKSTQILYCHWHFLKAVVAASRQKIKGNPDLPADQRTKEVQAMRSKAVEGIIKMMRAATEEELDCLWTAYQSEWDAETAWLKYISDQWHGKRRRWADAWRQLPHQGIDTNNYIERWHEELKRRYLKTLRKQRADYLIHLLVTKVVTCFQQQEKAVELGLRPRRFNKQELATKSLAQQLSVAEQIAKVQDAVDGAVQVQSFSNEEQWYTLTLNGKNGLLYSKSCTCLYFRQRHSECKHMWTAFFARGIIPENEKLADIFAKAEKDIGKFKAQHLIDLKASITALSYVAYSHYVQENPSATQ